MTAYGRFLKPGSGASASPLGETEPQQVNSGFRVRPFRDARKHVAASADRKDEAGRHAVSSNCPQSISSADKGLFPLSGWIDLLLPRRACFEPPV